MFIIAGKASFGREKEKERGTKKIFKIVTKSLFIDFKDFSSF